MTNARLADLVRKRAGMQLPPQRMLDLARSVEKMMKKTGIADELAFTNALETGRASLDDLVEDMLVGETYFFREPNQFAFLRASVIPQLRELGRPVRVWSAGCASGEEPYSLAITFEEAKLEASILASDLSRESLAEARAAQYGKWSLRGPEANRARSWLDGGHLDKRIRDRVAFQLLNLATDSVRGREFDLIFCRNVLIYFEENVIHEVAAKFHAALSTGGWLFTASSDPPLSIPGALERVPDHDVIAYRKVDPVALAARHTVEHTPRPKSRPRRAPAPVAPVVPVVKEPSPELPAADSQYVEATALIDQRRDDEAFAMLRRAIYLDPKLVVAHLALGLLLARRGDRAGARRELGLVRKLCASEAPEAVIPHSGGTCAAQLAGIAAAEEARLGGG